MKRQRTLRDDLVGALAVFSGFVLGALIFGADASILVGAVIGLTVLVLVRALRRRHQRG